MGIALANFQNAASHLVPERTQTRVVVRKLLGHRALSGPAPEAEGERRDGKDETGVEDESADGHCGLRNPLPGNEETLRGAASTAVSKFGS